MQADTEKGSAQEGAASILRLVIIYALTLVVVLTVASCLLWRRDNFIVMWVPVAIWEWSFAGAMVAVLYRLGSPHTQKPQGRELYAWAISRPSTGLFLGAIVYFVALAGARLLSVSPGNSNYDETLSDALWLNVVAFAGGFRDDLSIRAVRRFFSSRVGVDEAGKEQIT